MAQNLKIIKDKNHMIILIDVEKGFEQIQDPFKIKAPKKLGEKR
jgi:hypothetical protein